MKFPFFKLQFEDYKNKKQLGKQAFLNTKLNTKYNLKDQLLPKIRSPHSKTPDLKVNSAFVF